jgi:hypothetical protein
VASLKRAHIGTSRQPRRHLAFVLLAAAGPCLVTACATGATYGPGFGTLTGTVASCTSAEVEASGAAPDTARVVTVSAQNQAGQTVATRRLPLKTGGVRYRMRLPAGTYSLDASAGWGYSDGNTVAVTVDETGTVDFTGAGGCVGGV